MSVHTTTPPESVECGQCGDQFTLPAVEGSFCSPACHNDHRREKRAGGFFETLEHDHRFCSTCGRQLKTIEKPPEFNSAGESISDAVVGWQHLTEHGDFGEKSPAHADVDPDDLDIPSPDVPDGDAPVYVYELGDQEFNQGTYRDVRNPLPRSITADDPVHTGTICGGCGNTDHKHEDATLRSRFPFTVAHYLAVAAATFRDEDKTDIQVDRERLFEAVLEGDDVRTAFESAVIL